jgi:hypothetical protein
MVQPEPEHDGGGHPDYRFEEASPTRARSTEEMAGVARAALEDALPSPSAAAGPAVGGGGARHAPTVGSALAGAPALLPRTVVPPSRDLRYTRSFATQFDAACTAAEGYPRELCYSGRPSLHVGKGISVARRDGLPTTLLSRPAEPAWSRRADAVMRRANAAAERSYLW